MSEKELQEKYLLYQILQQNLENLKQQLEMVEKQFIEIKTTEEIFKDFKNRKGTDDVLLPLGSGCYGKGDVRDLKNVMVNVGANIMVNKTTESAKLFMREREKELERASKEIQEHMVKTANDINQTAMEIQKLAAKMKK
ncbi:MAG: prefoldin subunit alpha [Candidatus Aenigmarchaeota archaeon]|nr:prefoldin subunit alpha [Candidatus Aenigmarchaeota archaeon]